MLQLPNNKEKKMKNKQIIDLYGTTTVMTDDKNNNINPINNPLINNILPLLTENERKHVQLKRRRIENIHKRVYGVHVKNKPKPKRNYDKSMDVSFASSAVEFSHRVTAKQALGTNAANTSSVFGSNSDFSPPYPLSSKDAACLLPNHMQCTCWK